MGSDVFFILLILVEPCDLFGRCFFSCFFCFTDSRDVKGKLGGIVDEVTIPCHFVESPMLVEGCKSNPTVAGRQGLQLVLF